MNFDNSSIIITGGTGSFGVALLEILLKEHNPRRVVIYSRDEYKQSLMERRFRSESDRIRFFIGDVRDKDRLHRALRGIDYVIHAAALKQVETLEYNPAEAIKTNVLGAMNLIDAAIEQRVKKVIALSTDKACNPVSLYGASKLCSDKLFVAGNHYVGAPEPRFAVVRYGNVVGSRGSVVPIFLEQKKSGKLTITDERMTRFWITLEQGVRYVIKSLERMQGGEIFVPRIPSMKITDLAEALAPGCQTELIGIRPGEKLHEVMISEDDARNTVETDDSYIIEPAFAWWKESNYSHGAPVPEGFSYNSLENRVWLSSEDLTRILAELRLDKGDE